MNRRAKVLTLVISLLMLAGCLRMPRPHLLRNYKPSVTIKVYSNFLYVQLNSVKGQPNWAKVYYCSVDRASGEHAQGLAGEITTTKGLVVFLPRHGRYILSFQCLSSMFDVYVTF